MGDFSPTFRSTPGLGCLTCSPWIVWTELVSWYLSQFLMAQWKPAFRVRRWTHMEMSWGKVLFTKYFLPYLGFPIGFLCLHCFKKDIDKWTLRCFPETPRALLTFKQNLNTSQIFRFIFKTLFSFLFLELFSFPYILRYGFWVTKVMAEEENHQLEMALVSAADRLNSTVTLDYIKFPEEHRVNSNL